jgi:hypothetical protein
MYGVNHVIIPVETPVDKLHNDKSIIEISPNGKYIVTYSKEDRSIVGWNVEDIDEGRLEPDSTVKAVKVDSNRWINQICVSDDKKLAYIHHYNVNDKEFFIGK